MDESSLLLRQIPHSVEAEQSVLGAMLIDPRCIPNVVEQLTGEGMAPLEYQEVRGMEGVKEASYELPGKTVRVCVASGLHNVRQVLDGMEVRVPDSMVESQLTGLLHELESRLMSQGASLSDYLQMAGMTEEDLRSHARENALESARYELAMTEIARLEHIRVTDEDVERRYQEMSRQFGVPVEHIRQQLPPMQLSHDLKLAYARAVVVDSGVRL